MNKNFNLRSFSKRSVISSILFIFGLICGPGTLEAANASKPPLDWTALVVIIFGTLSGVIVTLRVQMLLKSRTGVRMGWHLLAYANIHFIGTGISAAIFAIWSHMFGPPAFLFLAISAGCYIGLMLTKPTLKKL